MDQENHGVFRIPGLPNPRRPRTLSRMDPILIVSNLFLLLFWVRLWSLPERELYFNPFLSAPTRLTDRILDFLRPVLPIPGRLAALLILAFLLIFRGIVLNHFAETAPMSITVGLVFQFTPRLAGLHGALIFSALHFFLFIAHFWGLYLCIQLLTPVLRRDRASEAFHFAALPLSALRWWLQIPLLVVLNVFLVYELISVGILSVQTPPGMPAPPPLPADGEWVKQILYHGWLTALSVADSLLLAKNAMIVFILGGLAAMLTQNPLLNAISNEGVNVLLGRFVRRVCIGLFDLTPILYFFAMDIAYALTCNIVLQLMGPLQRMELFSH